MTKESQVIRFVSGDMTSQEQEAFKKDLLQSDELVAEYKAYKKVWDLTNQLSYADDSVNESWHSFEKKVKAPFKILGLDWRKMAASITLLVAFSFSMWFFGSTDINLSTSYAVTPYELVDNSSVILQRNTTLVFDDKKFNKNERRVCLEGQAYFKITKSEKPFIIATSQGDVKVYGTEFNLFSDKDLVCLELVEGSVSFTHKSTERMIKPGERFIIQNGQSTIQNFNSRSTWSTDITCNDAPLGYILRQIKLVYGMDYSVGAKLLKERYTVSLPADNITTCIKILSDLSGKNFAIIDNTVQVK
ncbi:MAG: FecR family protein [Bacteroidia bacterium]